MRARHIQLVGQGGGRHHINHQPRHHTDQSIELPVQLRPLSSVPCPQVGNKVIPVRHALLAIQYTGNGVSTAQIHAQRSVQ